MGSNGDIIKYFIKIMLTNIDEPFIYEVGVEEVDRFKKVITIIPENDLAMKGLRFFCFKTSTNLSIAVSRNDINLVHFLWEKISVPEINDDFSEREEDIYFYFRNKPYTYSASFENPIDAALLYSHLDSGEFEEDFYSFIDVDGEQVSVRPNKITLVEINSSILNEGYDELNK